uniref:Ion transport domain-containing protein n=1 Tax=Pyramimonas obovata TaxID=1411642 RepID=A0A7S0R7I2_9CHLO
MFSPRGSVGPIVSVLHLCVLNDLPELYVYLVDKYGISEHLLNNENLTPLQLAAKLDKLDIFTFILDRRKTLLWAFGDVICFANSMTEHETQRTSLAVPSTMEIVVRYNRLNMMQNKFIVECLDKKWKQLYMFFWGLVYAYVGSYILFVYIVSKQTSKSHAPDWAVWTSLGFSCAWFIFILLYSRNSMVYYIETLVVQLQEVKRPVPRGMRQVWKHLSQSNHKHSPHDNWQFEDAQEKACDQRHLRSNIFSNISKVLKELYGAFMDGGFGMLVPYVATSAYSSARILVKNSVHGVDDLDDIVPDDLASIQTVAVLTGGYFMMFFFVTGIEARDIGQYIHIVMDTVMSVILPFAVVYFVLLLPHMAALLIQFLRESEGEVPEYGSIGSAMGKMLGIALTGMERDDFLVGRHSLFYWLNGVELVVYTLLVYVLLLNLLIAVLSQKIEEMQKQSVLHLRMRKARIILWLEKLVLLGCYTQTGKVGEPMPSQDPFRAILQSTAADKGAEYEPLKVVVRIVGWPADVAWECKHTVMVKRLLLDAAMSKPMYLDMGSSREFRESEGIADRSLDLLSFKDILGPSDNWRCKEDVRQVLATVAEMGKADRKRHEDNNHSSPHASLQGMIATHAKYPLWRNGCFVTGGDPKQDVVQSPDSVFISMSLFVPTKLHKPTDWKASLEAWISSAVRPQTHRPTNQVQPAGGGQQSSSAGQSPQRISLSHLASKRTIVRRLYLEGEFKRRLKDILKPGGTRATRSLSAFSKLVRIWTQRRVSEDRAEAYARPATPVDAGLRKPSTSNGGPPTKSASFVADGTNLNVSVDIVDESTRSIQFETKIPM